jgi:hypothetical protein
MELARPVPAEGGSGWRPAMVLPNAHHGDANLAVFQVTARLPVALELTFLSSPRHAGADDVGDRLATLTGAGLTSRLADGEAAFEARFRSTFGNLEVR